MKKALAILTVLLAAALLATACVQKAKIKVLRPGELKLTGVSKIALLPFNSIEPDAAMGEYAANPLACEMARRAVADVLSREPHFQLADLDLEKRLAGIDPKAGPDTRLDAVLYGRVWWQVTPEMDNFRPNKATLRTWKTFRYVCGESDGKPVYCTTTLTTEERDEFFKERYRAVTATLMLGLSLYGLDPSGRLTKLTHVYEVGTRPAMVINGEYSSKLKLLDVEDKKDQAASLKTEDGFTFASLSKSLGLASSSGGKAKMEKGVAKSEASIPSELAAQAELMESVSARLRDMIQPHSEEFEIVMVGRDKKTQALLITEAYGGAAKYLALKLADGNRDLAQDVLDVEFDKAAKEVVLRRLKAEHAADQEDLPQAERTPFVPPTDQELDQMADNYLAAHTDDMYNMALALEGKGDFERALYVYRFAFNNYAPTDQNMADGIGRCLLALDMADRVMETAGAKEDAAERGRLK